MNLQKPKFICTTPVRNESKILDRFLKCTSLWADHIIISDQCSEDNSKEIAKKYPKVILVENFDLEYNEKYVRQILIDEARKIDGAKLIFAVDADEILTPEILLEEELKQFYKSTPGTVFMANFVNICPDMTHYWNGPIMIPLAFFDDGSPYEAEKIHTYRNICPKNALKINLKNIKIMHYQFTDWERMQSKHNWYQCWERVNRPQSAVSVYRDYHHMYSIKKHDMYKIPEEWFENYYRFGIDIKTIIKDDFYYWDKKVLNYLDEFEAKFFSKEAIWDFNWQKISKDWNYSEEQSYKFRDPRNIFQKMVHFWLKKTQLDHLSFLVRLIDKILINIFKF
ncbi:MAG: glycosyltransferase family 2 protein [Actinobacteria bacterium]|nr:glycosyltransferase family 2 protein [Actinomycetota bacterium]